MLRAPEKITALYCILSAKDAKDEKKNGKAAPSNSFQNWLGMELQGDSNSISNQLLILEVFTLITPIKASIIQFDWKRRLPSE